MGNAARGGAPITGPGAHIENRLAEGGQTPEGATLDEMERLWAEAKAEERSPG
jgi:hypothetical protein